MTEQLALRPHHKVLEVGTGSGYQAAVLSRLAREVVSIERYRTLADQARGRLQSLGYDNVEVIVGDGFAGVPDRAPFDRIIVTAAAEEVPQALARSIGRRWRHGDPARAAKRDRNTSSSLPNRKRGSTRERLIPVRFVPLLPGQAKEL